MRQRFSHTRPGSIFGSLIFASALTTTALAATSPDHLETSQTDGRTPSELAAFAANGTPTASAAPATATPAIVTAATVTPATVETPKAAAPTTVAPTTPKPSFLDALAPMNATDGAFSPAAMSVSASGGSCALDGFCNFECGSPYDWDCASLACNEPNICGWTGGTCGPNEVCWVDICVCAFGQN